MNGVSVVVCCYNSALRLPKTVSYLIAQNTCINWEIIIVDNNSQDNTSEMATALMTQADIEHSIIKEPKPGLSFARKAGVKASKYDIIIFCDDDNWLAKDYVQKAYDIMTQIEEIGVLGGMNILVADGEIPNWIKTFEEAYACGPQAPEDGFISENRMYVTGAGMIIRRSILDHISSLGYQSVLTDRKGDELSSGGDTEMCFIATLLGYKIYYSSKLILYHYMEEKRLQWKYFIQMMKGHARSFYKLVYIKEIYNGEKKTDWHGVTKKRFKNLLTREIVIILYNYIKSSHVVTDRFSIDKMFFLEMFKSHIAMKSKYSEYMRLLEPLRNYKVKSDN